VLVLIQSLFINYTLLYLCSLHKYHVIYSFHVTAVDRGMYYPLIRGHACSNIDFSFICWDDLVNGKDYISIAMQFSSMLLQQAVGKH
jgi:hypothetical protein